MSTLYHTGLGTRVLRSLRLPSSLLPFFCFPFFVHLESAILLALRRGITSWYRKTSLKLEHLRTHLSSPLFPSSLCLIPCLGRTDPVGGKRRRVRRALEQPPRLEFLLLQEAAWDAGWDAELSLCTTASAARGPTTLVLNRVSPSTPRFLPSTCTMRWEKEPLVVLTLKTRAGPALRPAMTATTATGATEEATEEGALLLQPQEHTPNPSGQVILTPPHYQLQ